MADTQNKIIDFGAHIHLTDPPEYDEYRSHIESSEGDQIHSNIDALIRRYDQTQVDGAVLSSPFFMGHGNLRRVSAENDALISRLAGLEDYFGLAAIPTVAGGEVAAQEFQRCLDNGLNGGALETKSAGIELTHPNLEPIFEVASDFGAPILVHPKLTESLHPEALDGNLRLNAIFGREAAIGESLIKMVQDEVFGSYDELNLVYHHLGGNIASFIGRLNLQYEPSRWPNMSHLKSFDEVKAILENNVYLDTSGYYGYHSPLQTALEEFPSSQILFGSDFPYETRKPKSFDKFISNIKAVSPSRDSTKILGGNALELLINH